MKRFSNHMISVLAMCSTMCAGSVHAGGDYEITKYTIDGGGGSSFGGDYALSGTIGQFDAGPAPSGMSGGDYVIVGGFWSPVGGIKNTCPEDLNQDNLVDTIDLLILLGEWGVCPPCDADFNGDEVVDTIDLLQLLGAWGPCN